MDAPATPPPFSAAGFRLRARGQGAPAGQDEHGDHRLNPDLREAILGASLRDAAVLIAAVDHGTEARLLLTKRTETLRSHSGQISFPGGRIDAGDASPEAAALREAQEEVGLDPRRVEVVGRLPDYVSGSGFRIAPVLAVAQPPLRLVLNPAEVEAAFEVPLAFLMDAANHFRESRAWKGRERFFYVMPWEERRIWGITAGIIRVLFERLYA